MPVAGSGWALAPEGILITVDGTIATAYDPLTGFSEALPDLPRAFSSPAVAIVNGEIFIFGGDPRDQTIWQSNPGLRFDGLSWSFTPGIKTYKRGFGNYAKQYYLIQGARTALPQADGSIVLAGNSGWNGSEYFYYARVDIFHPDTNTWTRGPDLPASIPNGEVWTDNIILDLDSGAIVQFN